MLIEIKSWVNGAVLYTIEADSIKLAVEALVRQGKSLNYAELNDAELNYAELNGAELNGAKLNGAELNYAKLNGAKLNYAKLNGAKLNDAKLNYAELNGAKLNYAKLNYAKLNGAELNYAELDFSSWPLHCGSFNAKADDRLVAQLMCHLTRLDVSGCSGGVREAMDHLRKMALADLFCEYLDDVKPL